MAVVITDAQGRIEWINEGFSRITEYELPEILGKKPGEFLQGEETNPETIRLMREQIQRQEAVLVEVINYSKSGKKYWLQLDIIPVFDDNHNLMHFVGFETDITNQKEQQQRIDTTNQILEEVIYTNSHELRRPVANILGLLQLLEKTKLNKEDKQLLRFLNDSVQQLDDLLYSILNKVNKS